MVRISAFAFKAANEFVGRRTIIMGEEVHYAACNLRSLAFVLWVLATGYWADNAQPWLFLLFVGCLPLISR
eukprot:scaffold23663_cov94-Skeletonema_dohrnii-CCMP3373.AAC.1